MTTSAVLESVPAEPPAAAPVALWRARVGAFAIDVIAGLAVVVTLALVALAAPPYSPLWWTYTVAAALVVVAVVVNRVVLPALTGFSVGRAVFGLEVVTRDGGAAGMWRLLVRDIAHLLDTAPLFVGWLWPLWDRRRRTFADLLLRTEVRPASRRWDDARRVAAGWLIAATVICLAAVASSYQVVYRHERAVETAREQIAEEGPRIVEQLLSYRKDTLQEDFSRAQGLVTDSYRPQLEAQQNAVRGAELTDNEYWAVSSAVLAASPTTAEMLLAMQGQRGSDPQTLKFITATVRVEFEKSGDGQWRVANLTVLKKPQMNAQGQ
ncbi:putative membrane protein/domain protein [Mycolicibacterium phlei]|uniref:Membrane protein n=1 Tax=Mycolicibacterium phlei DSM 43239 = CCUG 21000 TaxID=1226750 RepID=A0A5N5UY20_MYCPH|nr:RDD family protein [Mycolicibacterium phlei]VEG07081.1 putative membrane protein/domain protein [Mycobacteroides chelonae]AMO58949.1 RDD family protein [Mycolicibacterium phlei]KAB7754522.1 membrane protein [Mycolicibacterium phlei DSM 43239 = CCUG 21000]KXW59989.1 membrane protein [Mycolicibacterium phlei DSM 43070]KXW65168.1 membrane protein [Mycolicibacterium phlei DSM 43239 = CCUG 21000]